MRTTGLRAVQPRQLLATRSIRTRASPSTLSPVSSTSAGSKDADVIIVGGGMAGLTCALLLQRKGVKAVLLEASDDIGGRVRTDVVDGFLLDRG